MTTQTLEQPVAAGEEVLDEGKTAKEKVAAAAEEAGEAEKTVVEEKAKEKKKEEEEEKEEAEPESSEEEKGPGSRKGSGASAAAEVEAVAESAAGKPKGVWIVRIPRVDVDNTKLKTLEAELEGLNKQVVALNAVIRVKRVEKEGAYQKTSAALEKLKVSSAASRVKIEELAPYREKLKRQQEQVRAMKDIGRDLQCKTEGELLSKIEFLEHSIAHGSMTLNEEKEVVKRIKKLNQQKESIKVYDVSREALTETKQEIDEFRDVLKVLNSELDILKFRETGHREVFLGHKAEEEKVSASLTELINERNDLKRQSDECYERVKAERQRTRKLIAEFSKFRQTRREVKELVEGKKYHEAVELGRSSVDAWFQEKWNADGAYRDKYVANMVKHRHKKTSIEEIESELKEAAKGRGRGTRGSGSAEAEPLQSPDEVVAALLEQANQDWLESKKPKVAPVVIEVEEEEEVEEVEEVEVEEAKEPEPAAVAPPRRAPEPSRPAKQAFALEIDETVVADFQLPSVVKEIISDSTRSRSAGPKVVYQHSDDKAQKKEQRRLRKQKKQEKLRRKEEQQQESERRRRAAEEERKAAEEERSAAIARRLAGQQQNNHHQQQNDQQQPEDGGEGPKQRLKRVKKNGRITFVPSDQKAEKPLVSSKVSSYAVPAVVGLVTVLGSLAGGVYYAYTS